MAAAILTQGLTVIRNSLKTTLSHIGVATDATAFVVSQTALDPANAGAADLLIKVVTNTDVDSQTYDATMTINGTTEMTGKNIFTIGMLNGALRTNAVSRSVRTNSIGVQTGDSFTIGIRIKTQDDS